MFWPNKTVYKVSWLMMSCNIISDHVIPTQGYWEDDERCGRGELTYNTGEVYSGDWKDDRQSEPCTDVPSRIGHEQLSNIH